MRHHIGDDALGIVLETVAAIDVAVDDPVVLRLDARDVVGIEAQAGKAEVFLLGAGVLP